MIYGEESAPVAFSGGLWISDTPDSPENHVRELKNLIFDWTGALIVRPSILASHFDITPFSQTAPQTVPLIGSRSVIYSGAKLVQGSMLGNLDDPNNAPVYIEPNQFFDYGGSYTLGTIHQDGETVRDQRLVQTPGSNFVQYIRKAYVWFANLGIVEVVGWNPGVNTTLTNLPVVGSPSILNMPANHFSSKSFLIVHKDRLFLFNAAGRVYFTETAAPGGFPETWDVATNFFIVPVREIEDVFVKDDDIFIWTSRGVWRLQVYGPPESWILKNILSDITVQDSCQVCLNKGVFYYVSRHSIMAFNGAESVDIAKPIQTYLDKCHGLGVFAFENGVLVCAEIFDTINYSSTVTRVGTRESRLFYFDSVMGVWTEIVIQGQTGPIVTGSFVDVWSPVSDQRLTTYFTMFIKTTQYNESYRQQTFYVSRLDTLGDSIFRDAIPSPFTYISSLPTEFSVKTHHWVGNSHKEKRIKMGYIKMRSTLETISIQTVVDGVEVDSIQELEFDEDNINDGYYHQALKMPGFARRIGININGEVEPGLLTNAITITPFNLTDITLIYNTGRNEEKTSSG